MHRPGIEPGAGRHSSDQKIWTMATANFTTKPPMLDGKTPKRLVYVTLSLGGTARGVEIGRSLFIWTNGAQDAIMQASHRFKISNSERREARKGATTSKRVARGQQQQSREYRVTPRFSKPRVLPSATTTNVNVRHTFDQPRDRTGTWLLALSAPHEKRVP